MRCVSPGYHWVISPLTGHRSWMPYPCGHCVACLHNSQDSWAIRLNEEAKHTERHEFIYDTLTFSPQGLPYLSYREVKPTISQESRSLLKRYSEEYARSVGEFAPYVVPYVDRSLIRDWIRQARELFVYHHGYRPNWKYVVFMEYGPKTSRPHFHLMFFNCSLNDYVRYLAKPWRRRYGFTKTKLVSNETSKGRECISRYVSKYCSKGVFESPLVQDGLAPKPFHCIAHGIGVGYLQSSAFDSFRSDTSELFAGVVSSHRGYNEFGDSLGFDHSRLSRFYDSCSESFLKRWSDSLNLRVVSIYVDEKGFKHALPRYYKTKLLGYKPNFLYHAVQDLLYARSEQYNQSKLFEFALQLGYQQADKEAPFMGFSFEQYDALSVQFFAAQTRQAYIEAKRRFIKLKNHYLRPLRNKAYAYVS